MLFSSKQKKKLKEDLFKTLIKNKNVISITLVGSFWEDKKSKDFSDIDVIIILKKFSKNNYQECLNKIRSLNLKKYNLGHLKSYINSTFGPLKFNTKDNIVFHVMIYDVKSHIEHVIKSPFTCFDWERSSDYRGKSLKEIFPVGKIQLVDFFKSRRGINSYLNNLNKNHISYQKYIFEKNLYRLVNKKFKINDKHKLEFSFHLCKFLIVNLYKFEKQRNKIPNDIEIKLIFKRLFANKYHFYLNNFLLLKKLKRKYDGKLKLNPNQFLKNFIGSFQKYLRNYKKHDLIILRHAKTNYNDGTFLGVGRNPGIINKKNIVKKLNYLKKREKKIVFASPLKRSLETAKTIEDQDKIIICNQLIEKNYGLAEGLNYKRFKRKYPSIISNWKKKKDPKFPSGENDDDILKRISLFEILLKRKLKGNLNKNISIVVTHNALMRCYLGNIFEIPKYLWIKISVKHIQPFNFIIKNNKIIPNIDRVRLFNNFNK